MTDWFRSNYRESPATVCISHGWGTVFVSISFSFYLLSRSLHLTPQWRWQGCLCRLFTAALSAQSLACLWRLVTEPQRSFRIVAGSLKFVEHFLFFFYLVNALDKVSAATFEHLARQWEEGACHRHKHNMMEIGIIKVRLRAVSNGGTHPTGPFTHTCQRCFHWSASLSLGMITTRMLFCFIFSHIYILVFFLLYTRRRRKEKPQKSRNHFNWRGPEVNVCTLPESTQ